jgi:hypothetical protein
MIGLSAHRRTFRGLFRKKISHPLIPAQIPCVFIHRGRITIKITRPDEQLIMGTSAELLRHAPLVHNPAVTASVPVGRSRNPCSTIAYE